MQCENSAGSFAVNDGPKEGTEKMTNKFRMLLILVLAGLFLFVLPINSGMIKDGGTTYWGPFIPIYQIRDVHGMTGCVDKDGNDVYLVGTEVYIFFIPVYESTHYEARGTGERVEAYEMVPKVRKRNNVEITLSDLLIDDT